MKKLKSVLLQEWIIIAVISVTTYIFAGVFDILETIYDLSREYEDYELDEIVAVCMVLSVCFFVLLYRRWREAIRTGRLMDQKNHALLAALDEIRQLKGILPICSNCKKIRDDGGYWHQVETYIREKSGAEFSHGICPECMAKLYPEFVNLEEDAI